MPTIERHQQVHELPVHLTINDLATDILRCGRSKAFAFVSDDANGFPLPALVVGRDRLWDTHEVLAWVKEQRPTVRNPRAATERRLSPVAVSEPEAEPAADADLFAGFTPTGRRAA